jgi:hypothetical protein
MRHIIRKKGTSNPTPYLLLMHRRLALLPRLATFLFLFAALAFFVLNPDAFGKLPILNLLEFNLQRVNYTFIMSLFAYTIPGILMTFYFGWHLVKSSTYLRAEAAILLVSSTLLIQLGSISTSPEFSGRTAYLFCLSWLFPVLHAVVFLMLALRFRIGSRLRFLTHLVLGLYILYEVPATLLSLSGIVGIEENVNKSVILCFLWYLSCPRLFQERPTKVLA